MPKAEPDSKQSRMSRRDKSRSLRGMHGVSSSFPATPLSSNAMRRWAGHWVWLDDFRMLALHALVSAGASVSDSKEEQTECASKANGDNLYSPIESIIHQSYESSYRARHQAKAHLPTVSDQRASSAVVVASNCFLTGTTSSSAPPSAEACFPACCTLAIPTPWPPTCVS